ncbi:MAG: S8 family serine peptidase [Verrucomicrobiota bacterium]
MLACLLTLLWHQLENSGTDQAKTDQALNREAFAAADLAQKESGESFSSLGNEDGSGDSTTGEVPSISPRNESEPSNRLEQARQVWAKRSVREGELSGSGGYKRVSFYYAENFKYPNIRFDEYFDQDPSISPDAKLTRQEAYVADHLIIRLKEGQKPYLDGLLINFGLSIRSELEVEGHYLVEFPLDLDLDREQLAFYQKRFEAHGVHASIDRLAYSSVAPDDPDYANLQWSLENTGQTAGTVDADIDAEEAWDIETGSSDVIVAVIDTGVDLDHLDIRDNLFVTFDGSQFVFGRDFVDLDNVPEDLDGHGTHVAGTIGARSNNALQVAGINWDVTILPVRVLDAFGLGTVSDVISGLNYAQANGAKIVNMSLGVSGGGVNDISDPMYFALRNARDAGSTGVLVVAAAGNDGINNDSSEAASFPASYDLANIISVAASDDNDLLADFSNFGATTVDLAAPGDEIHNLGLDNTTGLLSGTSMAAPHVTGVAALLAAQADEDDLFFDFEDLKDAILNSVDKLDEFDGVTLTGGRLNAKNALLSITEANVEVESVNVTVDPNSGNGDDILNPGETIFFDVLLQNTGVDTATGITLTLEITEGGAFASIVTVVPVPVINIPAGNQILLNDVFEVDATALGANDLSQDLTFRVLVEFDTDREDSVFVEQTSLQNATLSGFVYDAVDGVTPIAGATVSLSVNTVDGFVEITAVTDETGSYNIDTFAGFAFASASADGFLPSSPEPLNFTPLNPNQLLDFVIGTGDLQVELPGVNVTLPEGSGPFVFNVPISNIGTSPEILPYEVSKTEENGVVVTDTVYGMRGVGSNTPTILAIDEADFSVTEEIDITLPEGQFAVDLDYFDQQIWILAKNELGRTRLFAYSINDFSFLLEYEIDLLSVGGQIAETLLTVRVPVENALGGIDFVSSLAMVVLDRSQFSVDGLYQINLGLDPTDPDQTPLLSVFLGEMDELGFSSVDTTTLERMSASVNLDGGVFYTGRGNDIIEWEIPAPLDDTITRVRERETNLLNFVIEAFDIITLTYFHDNSTIYAVDYNETVYAVNWNSGTLIRTFDAPIGLERLCSSVNTAINITPYSVLSTDGGSVAKDSQGIFQFSIDTSDLLDGFTDTSFLAFVWPQDEDTEGSFFFPISLVIGDLDLSLDEDYIAWYQSFFLQDPAADDQFDDPDEDNVDTGVEYVIGTNPAIFNANPKGLPSIVTDPNTSDIFVEFRRRVGLAEGVFELQGKADLNDPWVALVEGVDYNVIFSNIVDGIEELVVSTPFNGQGFFRFNINL